MNKAEIITSIADKTRLSKKDTEAMLAAFQETVKDTLIAGDKVQMVGFGSFEVVERAAREGRNPATGQSMLIGPSRAPKFKASDKLKEAVNVK